jgi:hypothetical protein
MTRFRPPGIIGADINGTNYPRLIDHEACRHRQRPRLIPVKLLKINPEAEVDFTQIFRELKNQAELACHPIAGVAQQLKRQSPFFGKLAVELFELR